MADRPAQEWQKPDQNRGTAQKTADSLPLPNDDRLTLAQSRAGNKAGESAGYPTDTPEFYQVGPLTTTQPGTASTDLIGGRHPQQGPNKLDSEDSGGVFVVKPLPGARRQLVDPDADVKPSYDQQPGGF